VDHGILQALELQFLIGWHGLSTFVPSLRAAALEAARIGDRYLIRENGAQKGK